MQQSIEFSLEDRWIAVEDCMWVTRLSVLLRVADRLLVFCMQISIKSPRWSWAKSGTIVRFQFLSSHTKNPSEPQIISLVREEIQLTEDAAQAQVVEMGVPGGIQKLGWLTVPSFYEDPEKTSGGTV